MNMKNIAKKDFLGAAVFIAVCEAAGIVGAIFTTPNVGTWFANLNKPEIAPPNWLFAPVWTILFALMGVAAWLVWKKRTRDGHAQEALMLFFVQLFLNVMWSVLFFGNQMIGGALAEIVVLWLAIFLTISKFKSISMLAAYLLLPYVLWVSFAGYLNFLLYTLN
jgi:tryptophan-rich sensory protein